MKNKKKIVSSLVLAGILVTSALGIKVFASTDDYLKPVGIYKDLLKPETVVTYVLNNNDITDIKSLKVSDLVAEFKNVESVNGEKTLNNDQVLKTGDTFRANGKDYYIVIYGDVDADGKLTIYDALAIQNIVLDMEEDVDKFQLEAANVYHSDEVNIYDALAVQNYVLGSDELLKDVPQEEDTKGPEITLSDGHTDKETIYVGKKDVENFELPTATAIDEYDGNVEVSVNKGSFSKAQSGKYTITYSAEDKSKNATEVTLTVVIDLEGPTITGLEDVKNPYYINLNGEVNLPEKGDLTVTDNNQESIKLEIIGLNDVNTEQEGEYPVIYRATDVAGNVTEVTINVVVDDKGPVFNGLPEETTIYVKQNSEYTLPEVTAEDTVDGSVEVTRKIEVKQDDNFVSATEVSTSEETEYKVTYTAKDSANHEIEATLTIIVDGVAPEVSTGFNTQDTAKEVVVTITSTEPLRALSPELLEDGWVLAEDGLSVSKTYNENVEAKEITLYDLAGNEVKTVVSINWIDNKLDLSDPAVTYSETNPTNETVKVTITATEDLAELDEALVNDGWVLDGSKKSLSKDFKENTDGKITVTIKDLVGNEATVEVEVSNIDNDAPEVIRIDFTPTTTTNGTVIATIIANEELKSVSGTLESEIKEAWKISEDDAKNAVATFKANGTDTVTITDLAGNEKELSVTVKNIDTEAPTLEVSYSIDGSISTNQDVTVTVTSTEEIAEDSVPDGWTLSPDKMSITKEYQANGTENVTVKDLAGNSAEEVTVTVANIDKDAPVVTIKEETFNGEGQKASTPYQSKDGSYLSATFTEGVATLQKDEEASKGYSSEDEIQNEGHYTLTVKDPAGNVTTVEFDIDNTAPVFDDKVDVDKLEDLVVNENNKETYSIEASLLNVSDNLDTKEQMTVEINEIKYNSGTVDSIDTTGGEDHDGEYTVTYKATDRAGNEATITKKVIVDVTPAKLVKKDYSNSESAVKEVTVRVEFDENMDATRLEAGWVQESNNQKAYIKKYTTNATEDACFYDLHGNKTVVEINVANVDSDMPVPKVSMDPEGPTKENVTVTIEVGEEIQDLEENENWGLSNDGERWTLTKKYTSNTDEPEEVIIRDVAGNEVKVQVEVTTIDKKAPTLSVTYSIESSVPTNQNVMVTVTSTEEIAEDSVPDGWKLSPDKMSITKEYVENGSEQVKLKDSVGNESSETTVTVTNIDKEAPTVTGVKDGASYKNANIKIEDKNAPITATLQKNGEEAQNIQADEMTSGKSVSEEGVYTLVVTDSLGNTATIVFTIDNTIPEITNVVEGKHYMEATPEFTEGVGLLKKEIKDAEGSYSEESTKEYVSGTPITETGKYKLTVTDAAGNTATVTFYVDAEGPKITSPENGLITKDSVVINVEAGDIENLKYELKTSNAEYNGDFAENLTITTNLVFTDKQISTFGDSECTLTITDEFGRTSTVTFTLDTTAPEVTGVENEKVYKNATISFTDVNGIESATLQKEGEDAVEITSGKTLGAEDDGKYTLTVTDKAGNKKVVKFTIDNVKPVISGLSELQDGKTAYNTSVTLSATDVVTSDEKLEAVLEKDGKVVEDYKLGETVLGDASNGEEDGKYKLTVRDEAGNEDVVEFAIDTVVNGKVEYSNGNEEKKPATIVFVTITSDEELVLTEGLKQANWTLNEDGRSLVKTYTANTEQDETVAIQDKNGNTKQIVVKVEGIDNTAPILVEEPKLNENVPTKNSVEVTIKVSEKVKDIEGWTQEKADENNYTLKKTFDKNETVELEIVDLAGNKLTGSSVTDGKLTVTVNNIYKENPTLEGYWQKETQTFKAADVGTIEIPTVTATDCNGGEIKTVTVKIQYKANDVDAVVQNVEKIELSKIGTYTVTWSATDVAENTATIERTIIVTAN